jgi:DNA-binding MarR family transcriptional regulator
MLDVKSKKEGLNEIINLFFEVFQTFCKLDKQPMVLENGVKLYHAELHAISAIGNNPEINITDLANLQDVTKGAVSQIVNKLEKKQYVAKFKGENEKEINLRLTDKGSQIYRLHQDSQIIFMQKYEEIYDRTTEKDHNLMKEVLRVILKSFQEKCNM